MRLTAQEEKMLSGKEGLAVQMCMEIIIELGLLYGADSLLPITQAHIDGCCYPTVGEAGIQFAERLAELGARVKVPATLNVTARDIDRWPEFQTPAWHDETSRRMEKAYTAIGAIPTWTCAPYLGGITPRFGEQIAWAESNAIVYANSVLGARTNRYGDFFDACAAVTGRVPFFGLHRQEERKAKFHFVLQAGHDRTETYPLLGYIMGKVAGNLIPVVTGAPATVGNDQLKALSAAAASSGSVALFHMVGVTPEAPSLAVATGDEKPQGSFTVDAKLLAETKDELTTAKENRVDLVALGCPHLSYNEAVLINRALKGRRVARTTECWVFTNRVVYTWMEKTGLAAELKKAGVRISTDTCVLHLPLESWGFKTMMTDSAKFAHYAPGTIGVNVIFGSQAECIETAVSGSYCEVRAE